MSIVYHIVSKSEIGYGLISVRRSDGTRKIFSDLPKRFTIKIKDKTLYNRHIGVNRGIG